MPAKATASHDYKPQFVTNEDGERTGVLLSLEAYTELLEDLEDLAVIAERRSETPVAHEEVVARLTADGLL